MEVASELGKLTARDAPVAGMVVLAEHQTKGRGTKSRSFESSPGGNLYMTLLFSFNADSYPFPPLNLVRAVPTALCDALATVGILNAGIKWPNDVWVSGKKVAGVLIESSLCGANMSCLAGLGVNVNSDPASIDPALGSIATSLARIRGEDIDREEFLASFCEILERYLDPSHAENLTAAYSKHNIAIGKRIRVFPKGNQLPNAPLAAGSPLPERQEYDALAVRVDEYGFLIVAPDSDPNQLITLSAEDVSLRLLS